MKEAERLAERLETEAAAWEHHGNQSEWRETLRSAAALIRSQAEELERLRRALRETQKPKLITPVAVLNDDGSQSFSSQGLGER